MTTATRSFTVARTRTENGGIVDAAGWTGSWPFRKRISFHVGINCDSIVQSDGLLYVYHHGWTIAVSATRAKPGFDWSALLYPRHGR